MADRERDKARLRQARAIARLDASSCAEGGGPCPERKLWASMGRRGLLGWSIPAAFGGEGARYSDILPAVDAFVRSGGSPGLALSWAVHLIVAKTLIANCGSSRQKREILPAMASGKKTVSIALSEPKAGSDPKRIRTQAAKEGTCYVLAGEKTWLTNGPLADLFVVFAVTAEQGGRKGFTAFLVPKETPGLFVLETPPLGYLKPAPHCSIRLDHCVVPATAMLGREGRAWEDLSKPFRVVEDVLLSGGAVIGGLDRQLEQRVREVTTHQKMGAVDALERIGEAAALLEAARVIAREASRALDGRAGGVGVERRLVSLHLLVKRSREALHGACEALGCGDHGALGKDIDTLIALAVPAARARQRKWGYELLSAKETS